MVNVHDRAPTEITMRIWSDLVHSTGKRLDRAERGGRNPGCTGLPVDTCGGIRDRDKNRKEKRVVVDFLVNGRHTNGYAFYAPVRVWGPRGTDFDQRLRHILEMTQEIEHWEVEERRIRRLLSLFYSNEGHGEVQYVFYGDGPDQKDTRVVSTAELEEEMM